MKRLLTIVALATLLLSAHATDPVKQWGQLQVKGAQLCDQQGNPIVLRGVSFGWHNIWPRFYNKKAVKTLKNDWHATVIRAAMGVTTVEDNYLENPDFAIRCIENVVDAAIKNNVYVIIDWHAHEMHTQKAVEFFGRMAKKYGKYPHVIYELYNEPVNDSWSSLKEYCQTISAEIRKYDPDNIILMGCPHWDQDIHIVAKDPIKSISNLMYTLHFYAATHGENLRQRMDDAAKSGLPLFVSESGACEASGNGRLDEASEREWVERMEANKVSWVCWSLSDKDETCSMLLPRATATGPWADDVVKKYGKLVKAMLLQYNP